MRVSSEQRPLLEMLLTPIIRYFVRKSLTIQTFYDVAKTVYISVALDELKRDGAKINVSSLSAATGVTRNEVARIYKKQELPTVRTGMSIPARVMGQWELDPRFSTKGKKPRTLSYEGQDSEFYELVRSITKTYNPRTMLTELERIGAIEYTSRGVKLVKDVDRANDEAQWRIELAAQDMDVLIRAVDENMSFPDRIRNHHIHTEADNIVKTRLPEIRAWINAEGKRHHKKIREYLSKFDADTSNMKDNEPAGQKVVFSSFSFTTPLDNESE